MRRHQQQGFTLIELMIVVTIIAIMAAIAYPSYRSFVRQTQEENIRADLIKNAQALERYYSINNTYPEERPAGRPAGFNLIGSNKYFNYNYHKNAVSNKKEGYTLKAMPKDGNTINDRDIIYDSIEGMRACKHNNPNSCTPF